MASEDVEWCLVVPVKRLDVAKSRLGPPYDRHRRELALAFALDTTTAALATENVHVVLVVTDDEQAADLLGGSGAAVVADEPDAGLNPALTHGARVAAASHQGYALGALSADLPALRPAELSVVLQRAARHDRSFLRDEEGTGTTAVLARSLDTFAPAVGTASAARHSQAGLADVTTQDVPSVRLDVDTSADLVRAEMLGVGSRTASLLGELGYVRPVQATVSRFDASSRSGTVLLDDGSELAYGEDALEGSGVRLLRSGQRVRLDVETTPAGPRIVFLTIATLSARRRPATP